MLDFFYYYIAVTDNKTYIKLGITSNPKGRYNNYKTIIPFIKFPYVFEIKCNKKELLEFEAEILYMYEKKNKRIIYNGHKSECIYCNDENELEENFNEIYEIALIYFNDIEILIHAEAIKCGKKTNTPCMEKYKNSPEGQTIIANKLHKLKALDVDIVIEEKTDMIIINNDEEKIENEDIKENKEDIFPFELRGYQIEYYDKLSNIMLTSNSLIMNILCRCGKTVLFMKYIFDHRDSIDMVVYVAPRLVLIDEMASRLRYVFGDIYNIIEISSGNNNRIINPADIDCNKKNIVLTCNPSFKHLEIIKDKLPSNTVFVFDETHELVTKVNNDHPMEVLLRLWKPNMKKLFPTATPKYCPDKTDMSYAYMNIEKYYGSNCETFTDIKATIKQGFMVPMILVIATYDDDNDDNPLINKSLLNNKNIITNKNKRYIPKKGSKRKIIRKSSSDEEKISPTPKLDDLDMRMSAAIKQLNYMERSGKYRYKPSKHLIYTNNIARILRIESGLRSTYKDKYKIFTMHSRKSDSENMRARREFSEYKGLCMLINCKMIVSGINIPNLDSVILIDPKYQKEEIVQIIFRPRSYCAEKPDKVAYLIIPQLSLSGKFENISLVIRELYDKNDPAVVRFINQSKSGKKSSSKYSNKKNNKGDSVENDGDIVIRGDLNIRSKILDVMRKIIKPGIKNNYTMREAIIYVLSDDKERSVKDIWRVIDEKKLYIPPDGGLTPDRTCNATCQSLYKSKILYRRLNEKSTRRTYLYGIINYN